MRFRFSNTTKNKGKIYERTEPKPKSIQLEELCNGDKSLYVTMSYYLLAEPKRQLPLLGNSESYYERGLEQKALGNRVSARFDFELAARIEISKLNIRGAEEYLLLADSVSDLPEQIERHRILESNLEKVRKIAEEYYKAKDQLVTEKVPQVIIR